MRKTQNFVGDQVMESPKPGEFREGCMGEVDFT